MLQRFLLGLIIPAIVLILTSSGPSTPAWEKENVSFPMMNQEIRHSMQENERQKTMRDKQVTNLGLERLNKNQWYEFKETKRKIQDRLRIVDFALQAIPTGIVIAQEANRMADIQNKIWWEIETAPYSLLTALPNQISFVYDLQMVVRLIIGIVSSYGAINQMEKAERKILIDFALEEVRQLRRDASYMLMQIREIKRKVQQRKNLIKYYINRDKQIITEILNHF